MSGPARFKIMYRDGAYYVSIPEYHGGEVVDAAVADALAASLSEMVAEFGVLDDCDCASCAKVNRAREALAKVSA